MKKKRENLKNKGMIIALLSIIIVLGLVAGFITLNSDDMRDEESEVAIPGLSSRDIPANEDEVSVDFYNPEQNNGKYYLTFELRVLDDSREGYEVLYTSGLVQPGTRIQKIRLNRSLESGTYDSVIHIQPYRMNEERTPTNNADIKAIIFVQ